MSLPAIGTDASRSGEGITGFPTALFTIVGDPAEVKMSAGPYRTFAAAAGHAQETINGTAADSWLGTEGELFRSRRAEFVPMMSEAVTVFTAFASRVEQLADQLESIKKRMASLRAEAEAVWAQLQAARAAADSASSNLSRITLSVVASPDALSAAQHTADLRDAENAVGVAATRVAGLEAQWEDCCRRARSLHSELKNDAESARAALAGLPSPPQPPAPSAGGATATSMAAPISDTWTLCTATSPDHSTDQSSTADPDQPWWENAVDKIKNGAVAAWNSVGVPAINNAARLGQAILVS